MTHDAVQLLLDREEIHDVVMRYADGDDRRDYPVAPYRTLRLHDREGSGPGRRCPSTLAADMGASPSAR